jgi:hypothetical protein
MLVNFTLYIVSTYSDPKLKVLSHLVFITVVKLLSFNNCQQYTISISQTEYCIHNAYYGSNLAKFMHATIGICNIYEYNSKGLARTFK